MPAKSNEPIQRMNIWQRQMRDAAKDAQKLERSLGLTPRSRGKAGKARDQAGVSHLIARADKPAAAVKRGRLTIDANSPWTTPPPAARLAGDRAYRVFDSPEAALAFLASSYSDDAERQRRRRDRIRRHEVVALCPVGEAALDTLIALRWLDERQAEDRAAIGDAIARLLADLAQNR